MTKTKKITLSGVALVAMMFSVMVASTADAQLKIDRTMGKTLNVQQAGSGDIVTTILGVTKGLLSVVFVLAVLMFVISGLFFLTAAGSDRADLARNILTYAIVGLVVSILGYAIVLFLSKALIGADPTRF